MRPLLRLAATIVSYVDLSVTFLACVALVRFATHPSFGELVALCLTGALVYVLNVEALCNLGAETGRYFHQHFIAGACEDRPYFCEYPVTLFTSGIASRDLREEAECIQVPRVLRQMTRTGTFSPSQGFRAYQFNAARGQGATEFPFSTLIILSEDPLRPNVVTAFKVLHELGHRQASSWLTRAGPRLRSTTTATAIAWALCRLPSDPAKWLSIALIIVLFRIGTWLHSRGRDGSDGDEFAADDFALNCMSTPDLAALKSKIVHLAEDGTPFFQDAGAPLKASVGRTNRLLSHIDLRLDGLMLPNVRQFIYHAPHIVASLLLVACAVALGVTTPSVQHPLSIAGLACVLVYWVFKSFSASLDLERLEIQKFLAERVRHSYATGDPLHSLQTSNIRGALATFAASSSFGGPEALEGPQQAERKAIQAVMLSPGIEFACIHGFAGVGKSQLITEALGTWREPARYWRFDIGLCSNEGEVTLSLAHELRLGNFPWMEARLTHRLRAGRRDFLILDNADRFHESAPGDFARFLVKLRSSVGTRIISVTRAKPELPGAAYYLVRPMARETAAKLLANYLPGLAPGALKDLVLDQCAGSPLALRLAASVLNNTGIDETLVENWGRSSATDSTEMESRLLAHLAYPLLTILAESYPSELAALAFSPGGLSRRVLSGLQNNASSFDYFRSFAALTCPSSTGEVICLHRALHGVTEAFVRGRGGSHYGKIVYSLLSLSANEGSPVNWTRGDRIFMRGYRWLERLASRRGYDEFGEILKICRSQFTQLVGVVSELSDKVSGLGKMQQVANLMSWISVANETGNPSAAGNGAEQLQVALMRWGASLSETCEALRRNLPNLPSDLSRGLDGVLISSLFNAGRYEDVLGTIERLETGTSNAWRPGLTAGTVLQCRARSMLALGLVTESSLCLCEARALLGNALNHDDAVSGELQYWITAATTPRLQIPADFSWTPANDLVAQVRDSASDLSRAFGAYLEGVANGSAVQEKHPLERLRAARDLFAKSGSFVWAAKCALEVARLGSSRRNQGVISAAEISKYRTETETAIADFMESGIPDLQAEGLWYLSEFTGGALEHIEAAGRLWLQCEQLESAAFCALSLIRRGLRAMRNRARPLQTARDSDSPPSAAAGWDLARAWRETLCGLELPSNTESKSERILWQKVLPNLNLPPSVPPCRYVYAGLDISAELRQQALSPLARAILTEADGHRNLFVGELGEATAAYEAAAVTYSELEQHAGRLACELNLGLIEILRGRSAQAEIRLRRSIDNAKAIPFVRESLELEDLGCAKIGLACELEAKGRNVEAIVLLNSLLESSLETNVLPDGTAKLLFETIDDFLATRGEHELRRGDYVAYLWSTFGSETPDSAISQRLTELLVEERIRWNPVASD